MKDGFLRVAAASPSVNVADCTGNTDRLLRALVHLPNDTALLVFPELYLTGYTCGDLFLQPTLLTAAERSLERVLEQTKALDTVLVIGLPVASGNALYNCAAVCQRGRLLGLVPKTHIPNYSQYYEARHFSPDDGTVRTITFAGQETRLGAHQLFACRSIPGFVLGVEICEDLWCAEPPSGALAAAGATVIANPSASDESISKADYRRQLVSLQSARLVAGYVYASAGEGESTTDLVFGGHHLIAENGTLLAESPRFTASAIYSELDLPRLSLDRRRIKPFSPTQPFTTTYFDLPVHELSLTRTFSPQPFVPGDPGERTRRCEEILTIQAAGLAKRLSHAHSVAVLGISGGLDSALALLVAARAVDRLGKPRAELHAVTMPCFGTTDRTHRNATSLTQALGATLHEIDIGSSVRQHLQDIGHDESVHDVTYENAQARERTQVLMDLANQLGGIVVGTGDLSELALGWATYNGDHMSMYGVNASVPKTLVRYLVAYEADRCGESLSSCLQDILDTPVSPELLPPENGVISQKTEDLVGPYELHDFFLYYTVRFGCPPDKIFRLAKLAFASQFDADTIHHWLSVFVRRFFTQQFKRSCLPDGPRVGSVSLSPRGDWRMPSDASSSLWSDRL